MYTTFILSPGEVKTLYRIMANQIGEFNAAYLKKLRDHENWSEDEFNELDQRFKLASELYHAIEDGGALVEYTTELALPSSH